VHTSTALLIELGTILLVLSALAALARRMAFSPIPPYLLAGLALGQGGLAPVAAAGDFVEIGASIGVVLLLLALGLEFSTAEFTHSLRRHTPSAAVDLVLNATPGAVAGWLLGLGWIGSLALAGITWISSSGIIARLLADLGRLGNRETPAVLAVLVLEDMAMAAYLPLLAVTAAGGNWQQALLALAVAAGAVTIAFTASRHLGRGVGRFLDTTDAEQLLLRVFGLTLLVAGLAELAKASAAVGAFLVGLTLTGQVADRARQVIGPLRDLFAAAFFLAIGLTVDPRELLPLLPTALALAAVTAATKVATGWYAATRDGVAVRGRLRAGTVLIARGEFSIVIAGLAAAVAPSLVPLAAAYVISLALVGPVVTKLVDVTARADRDAV
jgi:monovalent cation:H+ antiporter-2, CPA2 family